jgi:hypothetical protein
VRHRLVAILYTVLLADLLLLPLEFGLPDDPAHEVLGLLRLPDLSWLELLRILLHVGMFVPVGAFLGQRLGSARLAASFILIAFAAEFLQFFVPRTISGADVACNLLGLLLGVAWARNASGSDRLHRVEATAAAVGAIAVLGLALVLSAPVHTGWGTWDTTFPLVLGDEANGGRPWSGELHEVAIFDRALDDESARALDTGRFADHEPLLHLAFRTEDLVTEGDRIIAIDASETGELRLRFVAEGAVRTAPTGGIVIEPTGRVIARRTEVLNARLRDAGAATIAMRMRALDPAASGPARIVSLSGSFSERNLTLGQERDTLRARVRNTIAGPNGVWPELIAPGTIEPLRTQTIVVVCGPRETRLVTAGSPAHRIVYRRAHRIAHDLFSRRLTRRFAAGALFAVGAICVLTLERLTRMGGPGSTVTSESSNRNTEGR